MQNFFEDMYNHLGEGIDMKMTFRRVKDKLTISLIPENRDLKDEAKNSLIPLVMTGKPAEFDADFFKALEDAHMTETNKMLVNMADYEKGAEKMANERKEMKEKDDNFNKHMKKADELLKAGKKSDALKELTEAGKYKPGDAAIVKKRNEILNSNGAPSLFGDAPAEPATTTSSDDDDEEDENEDLENPDNEE